MDRYHLIKQSVLCLIAMFLGGLLAMYYGRELCWDLAHYHYYIPYAFLHQRYQIDYWPASYIHQFLNPTIDLLTYGLIHYLAPQRAVFILGALHGINLWLLYRIAREVVKEAYARTASLLLAMLGLMGPTALPGMGSFQNDNLICIFVLTFVWMIIHHLQKQIPFTKYSTLMIGFTLGLGMGLKLTASIYFIAGLFAIPCLPLTLKKQIQWFIFFCIGVLLGVLITSGHWMWLMWQQHQNPLFPFFNTWFQSPDFAPINWRDKRFLPTTWLQTFFYPFYFSWDGRIADAPFTDIRLLILYMLIIPTVLFRFFKLSFTLRWILAYTIAAYVIWQCMFSIARYLAPIEMLTPILIYLCIRHWIENVYKRAASLNIIFGMILMLLIPIPMIRIQTYQGDFFNVVLPPFVNREQRATVLMAYTAYVQDLNPRPQTYLIPFFPNNWRFIGIPFLNRTFIPDNQVAARINALTKNTSQQIYLLTPTQDMPELYRAARSMGLQASGACQYITSDRQALTHLPVSLCPVQFISRMKI